VSAQQSGKSATHNNFLNVLEAAGYKVDRATGTATTTGANPRTFEIVLRVKMAGMSYGSDRPVMVELQPLVHAETVISQDILGRGIVEEYVADSGTIELPASQVRVVGSHVTDAEVDAAHRAWTESDFPSAAGRYGKDLVREMLEAARRAR